MKKAMISLSFDDGRLDNIFVAKNILAPRNLPATFNITTGYIDGTCPKSGLKTEQEPMSISDVKWLSDNALFEIAMHGDKHQNSVEDMIECRKKLLQWLQLPENHKFGFASPSSGLNINTLKDLTIYDKISYFRVGPKSGIGQKTVKTFDRIDQTLKIGRFYNFYQPKAFSIENQDSLMHKINGKVIYSVVIYRHTTCEEIYRLIDKCIRKKQAVVFMFHSILDNAEEISTNNPDNDLPYLWNTKKFVELCDYLKSKKDSGLIDVVATESIFKMIRRRCYEIN